MRTWGGRSPPLAPANRATSVNATTSAVAERASANARRWTAPSPTIAVIVFSRDRLVNRRRSSTSALTRSRASRIVSAFRRSQPSGGRRRAEGSVAMFTLLADRSPPWTGPGRRFVRTSLPRTPAEQGEHREGRTLSLHRRGGGSTGDLLEPVATGHGES